MLLRDGLEALQQFEATQAAKATAKAPEGPPRYYRDMVVPQDDPESHKLHALKTLEEAVAAVWQAGKGSRRDTLNRAASACGTFVPHGLLSEDEICQALEAAALACGLVGNDGL